MWSPKTYKNSTTLLISWNSSGGWGCNNFNNASNAHWQNSSASKALLNGLVQFSQCVLTRIYLENIFWSNYRCLLIQYRIHHQVSFWNISEAKFCFFHPQCFFKVAGLATIYHHQKILKKIAICSKILLSSKFGFRSFYCFLKFT